VREEENSPAFFPENYGASRAAFLMRAEALNWGVESHEIAARGPSGEALFVDVAFSRTEASRTLLVTSGLHGAEGPAGAAAQMAAMEDFAFGRTVVPDNARVVMVHALNPWGYAHGRRTDERNVDLNRNFLLPGQAYAGSPPGYAKVDALLNPSGPERGLEFFIPRLLAQGLRLGFGAVRSAIACGQYDFPRGLFYGGDGPGEIVALAERELQKWIPANSEAAVLVDLHTGLGRWGSYALLTAGPRDEGLSQGFRPEEISSMETARVAYPARGTFTGWMTAMHQARRFHAWGLEFGTYPSLKVLSALRRENRDFQQRKVATDLLGEVFCPASLEWRETVVRKGAEVIRRSLEVLGRA